MTSGLSLLWRTFELQLFSSLCVIHLASTGFDYVVKVLILPFCCGLIFVFGCKILFGMFQYFFVNSCSTVSCDFGVFIRGGVCKFSTVLSLTGIKPFSSSVIDF